MEYTINCSRCDGSIAQLGEHLPYKQGVTGSSPVAPTNGPVVQLVRMPACHAGGQGSEPPPDRHTAGVAHLVERRLAKAEVAGSSPVSRSIVFMLQGSMCPGVFYFLCFFVYKTLLYVLCLNVKSVYLKAAL